MESVSEHYAAMKAAIEKYTPHVDMALVDAGYQYAAGKHEGQLRKDGSPYIIHPLAVAEIVAEMGLDTDSILAALLTTVSRTPTPATRRSPVALARPLPIWWRVSPKADPG